MKHKQSRPGFEFQKFLAQKKLRLEKAAIEHERWRHERLSKKKR